MNTSGDKRIMVNRNKNRDTNRILTEIMRLSGLLKTAVLSSMSSAFTTKATEINKNASFQSFLSKVTASEGDEQHLKNLFKRVECENSGRIHLQDLKMALNELDLPSMYAQLFVEPAAEHRIRCLELAECLICAREQCNLLLHFAYLEKNKHGKVEVSDLLMAFRKMGIQLDLEEAQNWLSSMHEDGNANIERNVLTDFSGRGNIKLWQLSYGDGDFVNPSVPEKYAVDEMEMCKWWKFILAGGMAGAISRTCTAPLDRIKIFLQVQPYKDKKSITATLKDMLREGGIFSLWRGNAINVLKIAPEYGIKFSTYEQLKRLMRGKEMRTMSIIERFLAGAAAGGISQTIIYPMEVLKTRLALRTTGQYTSIFNAAKQIYVREGLTSFYRGYIPNILGILPYAGIDLAVYETLKKKYLRSHPGEQPGILLMLACGSVSCTLGHMVSYPLAMVRTRLQAEVILRGSSKCIDDNLLQIFQKILRTQGIIGLYQGITPNLVKVIPAMSITYVVYEYAGRNMGIKMA